MAEVGSVPNILPTQAPPSFFFSCGLAEVKAEAQSHTSFSFPSSPKEEQSVAFQPVADRCERHDVKAEPADSGPFIYSHILI